MTSKPASRAEAMRHHMFDCRHVDKPVSAQKAPDDRVRGSQQLHTPWQFEIVYHGGGVAAAVVAAAVAVAVWP